MPPKVISVPAPRADAVRLEMLLGAVGGAYGASSLDLEEVVALAIGFTKRELAKEVLGNSAPFIRRLAMGR